MHQRSTQGLHKRNASSHPWFKSHVRRLQDAELEVTQQPSQNEEKQVGSSVRQPVEVSFFLNGCQDAKKPCPDRGVFSLRRACTWEMLHERFQVATHRAENIWGDFPKVFLVMAMYLSYTWDILYLVHFLLMSSLSHSKKSRTPWTMPFPSDSTNACERMPARGLLAGRRAGVQPLSARLDMGHSQCFLKRCWVSIPENQSRWIHTSDRKSHGRLADLEGKRWGHHSRTLFHRRLCSPCADRGCPTLPSEVHRLPSGPVPWCNCSIFFSLGHHWSPLVTITTFAKHPLLPAETPVSLPLGAARPTPARFKTTLLPLHHIHCALCFT